MKKYLRKIYIISVITVLSFNILLTDFVQAGLLDPKAKDEITKQADKVREGAGFTSNVTFGETIAFVIKAFLSLLGVIFIILILIAGYKWMTAAGNEEKVKEAKDTIRRAIIGLLIVVSAYAITHFVFTNIPWGGFNY